jgi:outer membrane immunogenic protein
MNRFAIALLAGVASVSLVSAATAADLIIHEPAPMVPVSYNAGGNWDGIFVGAFAGYGWGTLTDEENYFGDGIDTELDVDGWQVGVAVGANFTVSEAIVAGIVADIAWADIGGTYDDDANYNVDWIGSVRGRLGFDGGAFMPYVTGGLAFANNTITDDTFEDSNTHIGWTLGAGVEVAVADNVSLDLLYRYSDYGSKSYTLDTDTSDFSLTSHAVTAGINFKF